MTDTPPPAPPAPDPFKGKSTRHHMVVGTAWMTALRWGIRGIGLISTIILARLLAPEDFGLVAIAMLSVAFLEVMTDTGLRSALIRHEAPERAHYDTAFTLNFLVALVLFTAQVSLAAPLARFFDAPAAELLIKLLAFRTLLLGLENIATVNFMRDLAYARDFRFNVATKLISAVLTVTVAVILRNYWALVIGLIGASAIRTVLSYWLVPYLPRPNLSKTRELLGFSTLMILQNYALWFNAKVDQIVVGRMFSTEAMGIYAVGSDVGQFATAELVAPLRRALFPIFAKLSVTPRELVVHYRQSFAVIALICTSVGTGIALVSRDLVLVAFGEKWIELATVIPWIALAGGLQVLGNMTATLMQAVGRPAYTTILQYVTLAMMAVALPLGGMMGGIEGVALGRMAVMVLFVPMSFLAITRALPLTWGHMVMELWRPVVASAVMAGVLVFLVPPDWSASPLVRLIGDSLLGAVVFAVVLLGLWTAAGRPPGVEAFTLRALRTRSFTATGPGASGPAS
ncbi:lipopolysaccharide biosynthesis protein [Futiania mangrovi]|uniref:Lipopolysaccharide biosynthesis protein n=1 Tax=Futiania mangrovi TaxID=2959716 RepID=A0A9J6PG61_9PROT|nr:lipopolysaccharide biosynthesis protein [Futiania mangrovii]MCP1337470.1 lipopolysaccharide biosynthesis protein [Futiania mangrovii]